MKGWKDRILYCVVVAVLTFGVWACDLDDDFDAEHSEFVTSTLQQAIVNGEESGYDVFQGVIAVFSLDTNRICSGTLIAPDVVLTAAHCIYWPDYAIDYTLSPSSLIILGGADLRDNEESIYYTDVKEAIVHPSWKDSPELSTSVDLALLKLSEPLNGVETYGIRDRANPEEGSTGFIVGYGITSSDDPSSYGVHRLGESEVLSVNDAVIEVGNPSGACNGDSGGPFFTRQNESWVITGVTSYRESEECSTNDDAWEVNTLTYREWIDEALFDLVGVNLEDIENGQLLSPLQQEIESPNEQEIEFTSASVANGDSASDESLSGMGCSTISGRSTGPGLFDFVLYAMSGLF